MDALLEEDVPLELLSTADDLTPAQPAARGRRSGLGPGRAAGAGRPGRRAARTPTRGAWFAELFGEEYRVPAPL
ncbi:MAG: hypothetical protein R3F43_08060 [bacterium]